MGDRNEPELQKERGVNEQYMRLLRRQLDNEDGSVRKTTSVPRNSAFLGSVPQGSGRMHPVEPLIGRVALTTEDAILGSTFYIGSGRLEADGLEVIKWLAPMAQLFYKGASASVDLADQLAARRTFTRRIDELIALEDELESGVTGEPFAPRQALFQEVEPPPSRPSRPVVDRSPSTPVRPAQQTEAELPVPPSPVDKQASTHSPQDNRRSQAEPPRKNEPDPEPAKPAMPGNLRAPETVLAALNAPRTGRLHSLLRTLQPQQYDLVTANEDEHLIVQGHPGTGKTVVGLHRAAYLTDADRLLPGQRQPPGDVLVLGPTSAYVDHVRPVLHELADGGWTVWSLPHLYAQLGEFKDPNVPTESDRVSTSVDPLGQAVLGVLEGYEGPRQAAGFVNHLLRCGDDVRRVVGDDQELLDFLRQGRNYEYARSLARFHPMLALAGLAVSGVRLADRFRHVIVDEAQDLRPIDLLLLRLLVSQGVTLTLLGDMNQRRSDFTHDSWDQVALAAGISDPVGRPPLISVSLGYRSTKQILRFASGLLPQRERNTAALREGPIPRTIRAAKKPELESLALSEALRLQESTEGLVAVLTMDPPRVSAFMRKEKWSRGARQHSWRRDTTSPEIVILHPDNARGLEFDGVVVIEPADFPAQVGRQGVLYTSLTRATKELSVVHHKGLPDGLRSRKDRHKRA
jgi:DNA helicase-2/ATP-dependent DNA helicase PcrA